MKAGKSLWIGSTLWVHFGGRTYTLELSAVTNPRMASAKAATTVGPHILKSPMPGKVLKINFKVGDSVKTNSTICVLEAMKMEYTLKSPKDAKVKTLFKSEGDLVELDEKVVEIE